VETKKALRTEEVEEGYRGQLRKWKSTLEIMKYAKDFKIFLLCISTAKVMPIEIDKSRTINN